MFRPLVHRRSLRVPVSKVQQTSTSSEISLVTDDDIIRHSGSFDVLVLHDAGTLGNNHAEGFDYWAGTPASEDDVREVSQSIEDEKVRF